MFYNYWKLKGEKNIYQILKILKSVTIFIWKKKLEKYFNNDYFKIKMYSQTFLKIKN